MPFILLTMRTDISISWDEMCIRDSYKLVRIGGSGLSFADHYRAGRYIARAAENLGRSVFIVASGDLSHKLRGDGPYGYSVQAVSYTHLDVYKRQAFNSTHPKKDIE